MKKYLLSICAPILILALTFKISAEPLTEDALKLKMMKAQPGLPILTIEQSDLDGYYEVVIQGGQRLFVDATGSHFFVSDLWTIEEQGFVNVTETHRTIERARLLATLDESQMVVFAPEKGEVKKTITVFTDIDCGYCRKLHNEVPALNDMGVAVRYLAFPRAGFGSPSFDKIVSAWCADDPQDALTRAKRGEQIEEKTCANPVANHLSLVDSFGITGTPAVILEDGRLVSGYRPAALMAQEIGLN